MMCCIILVYIVTITRLFVSINFSYESKSVCVYYSPMHDCTFCILSVNISYLHNVINNYIIIIINFQLRDYITPYISYTLVG